MIERLNAKNGMPILKRDGRFVCSSVDPIKEAQGWLSKNKLNMKGGNTFVILGVGCGYHIALLKKEYGDANILAIDATEEFIHFSQTVHSLETATVTYLNLNSAQDIKSNKQLRNFIKNGYVLLKYSPALIGAEDQYQVLESLLVGREKSTLKYILNEREELKTIFNVEELQESLRELISIKTLNKIMQASAPAQEALILKSLEELVI